MSLNAAYRTTRRFHYNVNSAFFAGFKSSLSLQGNLPQIVRTFSSDGGKNAIKGSGLRRIQNKGRSSHLSPSQKLPRSPPPNSNQSSVRPSEISSPLQKADPELIASELFSSTAAGRRTPGTEAIATLTREQKISNYVMASGLLAVVSYIFYYSLASVGGEKNAKHIFQGNEEGQDGGVNSGFEAFLKEANEGRDAEERRLEAEKVAHGEAQELADLENTTTARLKAEGIEDVIVAASASEEEEREMVRSAGFDGGHSADGPEKPRPLWKRIIFFWRRE